MGHISSDVLLLKAASIKAIDLLEILSFKVGSTWKKHFEKKQVHSSKFMTALFVMQIKTYSGLLFNYLECCLFLPLILTSAATLSPTEQRKHNWLREASFDHARQHASEYITVYIKK